MRHLSTLAVVLAVGLVSSACSTGYDADLAELRQQHATAAEPQSSAEQQPAAEQEPLAEQEPAVAAKRVKRPPAGTARASAPASQRDTTVGQESHTGMARGNELKPWPKRGTPEAEQLQADEIKQEQRINELIHNICRGC